MRSLEAYMMKHGLTQEQVAQRSGLSKAMLNQINSGKRRPSPETAKRIEAATDGEVSATSLLGLAESGSRFQHELPPRTLSDGRWAATVAADGSLFLTPEVVQAFGFEPGERLVLHPMDGDVRINSADRALLKMQRELKRLAPPGVSVVDDFIADKRAEAARE